MSNVVCRGIVKDGKVVLLEQAPGLSDGTIVLVTPAPVSRGTAAAVLAAMEAAPTVPAEWVDELEALITSGRRPPTARDPFGD